MPALASNRAGFVGGLVWSFFISFFKGPILVFLRMLASFRQQFHY